MSDDRVLPDVSRSDFLKLAGLSALLPLIGSVTPASAEESRERVYVLTHSDDDVDRAALALLLAGIDAKKIGKAEYLDGLERKGGDYVAAQVGKADVIWM
jgi:hypothetical protein